MKTDFPGMGKKAVTVEAHAQHSFDLVEMEDLGENGAKGVRDEQLVTNPTSSSLAWITLNTSCLQPWVGP